jgi:hypothetical protein
MDATLAMTKTLASTPPPILLRALTRAAPVPVP